MAGPWQHEWSSHTPSSAWSYGPQLGSGVVSGSSSWQQGAYEGSPAGKKDRDKIDKYRNITTLGQGGRHCLTLDDSKALVIALLALLSPKATVLSKLAISQFNATTTHALLYWLTKVTPRTAVRVLRDDEQVFTIAHAAHLLAETAVSFHGNE